MKRSIYVDDEMLDRLIINELKDAFMLNKGPDKIDCSDHYLDVDTQLLYSLDNVLRYYMAPDEYDRWLIERNK